MTLKFEVDSLEGLPEEVSSLYSEAEDGKFRLTVEGLPDSQEATGLKKTVDELRKELRQQKNNADSVRKKYEKLGKSPEEIEEILAHQQKLEEDAAKKRGDFEALRKQDREKFEKQIAEKDQLIEALQKSEKDAFVSNHLMTALAKRNFTETGLNILPAVVSSQIKVETEDGKRVVRIYQQDGKTPLAGSGDDGLATFEDFAKSLAEKYPELVRSEMRPGGGKEPGAGKQPAGGGKTVTRSQYEAAPHDQRGQWMAEGYSIVDDAAAA